MVPMFVMNRIVLLTILLILPQNYVEWDIVVLGSFVGMMIV